MLLILIFHFDLVILGNFLIPSDEHLMAELAELTQSDEVLLVNYLRRDS
jgi:hypothetical protein